MKIKSLIFKLIILNIIISISCTAGDNVYKEYKEQNITDEFDENYNMDYESRLEDAKGVFTKDKLGYEPKTITVLEFDNIGVQEEKNNTNNVIYDIISDNILFYKYLNYIDSSKKNIVLEKQMLYNSDFISSEEFIKIGNIIDADIIITGTYANFGNKILIQLIVVDTKNSKIVWKYRLSGNRFQILDYDLSNLISIFMLLSKNKDYGTVNLNCNPNDSPIFINNFNVVRTKIKNKPLEIGRYKINIIHDEYEANEIEFEVKKDKQTNISTYLIPKVDKSDKFKIGLHLGMVNNSFIEDDINNKAFNGIFFIEQTIYPISIGFSLSYTYNNLKMKDIEIPLSSDYTTRTNKTVNLGTYLLYLNYYPFEKFDFTDIISPYTGFGLGVAHHDKIDSKGTIFFASEVTLGIIMFKRYTFSYGIDIRYRYCGQMKYNSKEFNWIGTYKDNEEVINLSYIIYSYSVNVNF